LFTGELELDGKVKLIGRAPDGKIHLVSANSGPGTPPSTPSFPDAAGYNDPLKFFVADVTGDGSSDLVTRTADGTFHTYPYDRASFGFKTGADSALGLADSGGWGTGTRYFLMDVNGDGRTDLVARFASGNLMTYLSNGTTFVQAGLAIIDQADTGGWGTGLRYFPMDVNGDGKMDLVARNAYGDFLTFLSTGTTFVLAGTSPLGLSDAGGWNSGIRYFTLDVNGDGLTDLVARDANGNFTTYLSNGSTFTSAGVSWFPGHTDVGGWNSGWRYFVVDFNGDGLSDILARYADGRVEVFASNGIGFNSIGAFALNMTDATGWNDGGGRFFTGDNSGSGKGGLIGRSTDGSVFTYKRSELSSGSLQPDLMIRIVNGLGTATDIDYSSLAYPFPYTDIYTADRNAVYPIKDVRPAMYVVAAVANANGTGDQVTTTYTYGGLKIDQSGRNSLGFRWVKSVQQESGLTTLTENRQDWPYVGLPVKITTSLSGKGNGGTLRQIDNVYGCIGYDGTTSSLNCAVSAGRRYFPVVSSTADMQWDLNGALSSSVNRGWQYDAYGNVTQATMSSSDGYSQRVDNTYTNDTANWFLGLLTRSTTSKQTP
jgi:hypothetical protein